MYIYVCTFAIQSNVQGINLSKDMSGNACFLKRYHSNNQCSHNKQNYEGQSLNSDNGSISQNILESELFVTQNVDMGVAYSCLKYGVFITARFDAMSICMQHCEYSWPRKSPF